MALLFLKNMLQRSAGFGKTSDLEACRRQRSYDTCPSDAKHHFPNMTERTALIAPDRTWATHEGDEDVHYLRSRDTSPAPSRHDSSARFRLDPRTISDATIGLSDGLTVPFALTAGLSGLGSVKVVVLGGLAELIAGAISMGLGGWMGARSEVQSAAFDDQQRLQRCERAPSDALAQIATALEPFDLILTPQQQTTIRTLPANSLAQLLQRVQGGGPAADDDAGRPPRSPLAAALTIALGYFVGGFIPLLPYIVAWLGDSTGDGEVLACLWWSVGVMAVALLLFGYAKAGLVEGWAGRRQVWNGMVGALEMLAMGGAAAGAAVGLVRGLERLQ